MSASASILELRRRSAAGIYAVSYRNGRARGTVRLTDGLIVETPTAAERREVPDSPAPCLELAAGGGPATIHHVCLGLVAQLLALDGVYLLPSGDVAAIYGADVLPIGAPASSDVAG